MTENLPTSTHKPVKRGFIPLLFKHKYSLLFALGFSFIPILLTGFGGDILASHSSFLTRMDTSIKSFAYLFIFLHILILIAIYLILVYWADSLCRAQEAPKETRKAVFTFIHVFMAGLFVIFIAGHLP